MFSRLLSLLSHASCASLLLLNVAHAAPVSLTLYNGQHESTGIAIAKAFTEKTGIEVKIRKGGSGQLASQIAAEGNRTPADIIYTEESPPLAKLSNDGLLAALDASTLALVDKDFADVEGRWVGITARTRVLAYNPKLISEQALPSSVLELAEPQWEGKVGFVPTSGAFQEQVVAVLKLNGREAAEDWLTGLKAFGKVYTNNVVAMKAVEKGEIASALINNYYWFALSKEKSQLNSKLHYFMNGDAGGLVTVSGAAILAATQHPKEAQQFIAFMLSEEGQRVILSESPEYPVRTGMLPDPALKPFAELQPPKLNAADIGEAREALELSRDAGLN